MWPRALLWDCDIEKYASDIMCGAAPVKNYYNITATLKNKKDCDIAGQTKTQLKKWWDECTAIDLTQSVKYTAEAKKNAPTFSHPWSKRNPLYKGEVNRRGSSALPYYRRLVATGWQEVKDGYAPRAKAMLGVKYGCGNSSVLDNIGNLTKILVENCPKNPPQASIGFSLNHYYNRTLQLSAEELLEAAITKWVNEASAVGKDNKYKKDAGFNNYANMMHDKVNQVTCAVNVCTRSGESAVICQYNEIPDDEEVIYQLGTPCKGCPSGTSCDNNLGGGLCV
ncbi:hypothetical protein ANCCEY_03071 [Ancylostoma ceylanicum]|uniref:SCP domain-containing protein n=1 Tax=Ancylostoma ceylanicum TaxID=53326 RepID=A0A0D6M2U8_9BILA|nr:hypothetical protein ANCCEY_03071 [Ancylostoma ceylanicum]